MPFGQHLKTLRNGRNITVREVEHASRRIAEAKADKRFCISNGWLAQLENGVSEPSICKIFSLSVIYRVPFLDLVRLYNVDVDEKEKYEHIANPSLTQLICDKAYVAPQLMEGVSNGNGDAETVLFPGRKAGSETRAAANGNHDRHIIYAHLGLKEFTMYPMIRPGALLRIDTKQNKPAPGIWHNEYERPIFFIELRGAYACGWCELQGNQLLIIPHHSSPASVRRFTFPREAEIVGRVVGYDTSCVDLEVDVVKPRRKPLAVTTHSS